VKDSDRFIPFENLPDRFVESLERISEPPVAPRPAATIVLMRDVEPGIEILLLKRSRSAGFVPGAYVFPGGRVDASDATEDTLSRMDGLTPEAAAERLELPNADPPAIAYYLAALREAFEETGILIGSGPDGEPPRTAAADPTVDAVRDDLMEDRVTFAEVLDRLRCRIDGTSVEYLAHWVTPLPEPRRFDTRFFAARVPAGSEPIVDPREMTDALWIAPADALQRSDNGELPMIFPTIKTLEHLSDYATPEEAITALAALSVRTIMPTLIVTDTGVRLVVDDDDLE
jgi:8-oxo-dGTP pyrophosphatase MutT (NUDIX family)